jgi:Bacitracin resistance protein BacA
VISTGVGWLPTVLATGVSFVVGYASIAWLLRFVAKHRITVFIWYRVALAAVIAVLLGTGMLMRFSTLRRISSLIGRTASTLLPAGSSSTQSS